jgi:hypothetical protein
MKKENGCRHVAPASVGNILTSLLRAATTPPSRHETCCEVQDIEVIINKYMFFPIIGMWIILAVMGSVGFEPTFTWDLEPLQAGTRAMHLRPCSTTTPENLTEKEPN